MNYFLIPLLARLSVISCIFIVLPYQIPTFCVVYIHTGEHVLDAIPAEPGVAERGVLPLLLLPPPPPPLIQASQAG